MNKISLLILTIIILVALYAIYLATRPPEWKAWPAGIIVDTFEEWNRKNTP